MSEFTCHCGELMAHGECPACGSHRAAYMDGLSRSEWQAKEKYESENDGFEQEEEQ